MKKITIERSSLVVRQPILLYFLLGTEIGVLLFRAWFRARYFDGNAVDGPFYLFNVLERMTLGQLPERDFVLFHGFGIAAAHYPIYLLFGRSLFASEFARQLLSPFAWVLAMAMFTYAVSESRRAVIYAVLLLGALVCIYDIPGMSTIALLHSITDEPGNSQIALRWAYPAACGIILPWAFGSKGVSATRGAIAGTLFGLAPAWSFEQGACAIAAALVSVTAWCMLKSLRLRVVIALVTFVLLLVPTVWLSFQVVSGFQGLKLLRFAFQTIPQNQGWYFGAPPNLSLAVPSIPVVLQGLTPSLAARYVGMTVLWYAMFVSFSAFGYAASIFQFGRNSPDSPRLLTIGFLACYALLSGCLLSGYIDFGYLLPCASSTIIIAITLGRAYIKERLRAPLLSSTLVVGTVASILIVFMGILPLVRDVRRVTATQDTNWQVSGVYPSPLYRSLLPLVRRVQAVPNATIFSTVRGMLDIATDQPHHGRTDLIDLAVDDSESKEFLETFLHGKFSFVQTVKPDYLTFEQQFHMSHWELYRSLVERFRIVEESAFSILWERRPDTLTLHRDKCRGLTEDAHGIWQLPPTGSDAFLELTADYQVKNPFQSVPVFGALPRYLLEYRGFGNSIPVSLNPHHTSSTWLARSLANSSGSIAPKTYSPVPGANLTVTNISACEIRIPPDAAQEFSYLTPSSSNN